MELGIQLVHISGELDFAEASAAGKNLSADHQSQLSPLPFTYMKKWGLHWTSDRLGCLTRWSIRLG